MLTTKKIIYTSLKILLGLTCLIIFYFKLKPQLTPNNINYIKQNALTTTGFIYLLLAFILVIVNWGIEAFKWQKITQQIEKIKYSTAFKSVLSGVCLGNFAPGRATEFIGKIFYFNSTNRPAITVLHFINGLFQLIITVLFGCLALSYNINFFSQNNMWIVNLSVALSIIVIIIFICCLIYSNCLISFITKKLLKQTITHFNFEISKSLIVQLLLLSTVRYFVFCLQFYLVLILFNYQSLSLSIFFSLALYYLFTTIIPMLSFIEPVIRATIVLIVFANTNFNSLELSLTALIIWLINIIFPSIVGYIFLVSNKFQFNLIKQK